MTEAFVAALTCQDKGYGLSIMLVSFPKGGCAYEAVPCRCPCPAFGTCALAPAVSNVSGITDGCVRVGILVALAILFWIKQKDPVGTSPVSTGAKPKFAIKQIAGTGPAAGVDALAAFLIMPG